MPASAAPPDRPREVTGAFWCWVVAAVLLAVLGLLLLGQPTPLFFHLVGVLLVLAGLAQGYLAGRTRSGRSRWASAAVGLAMASVALLAVLLLFGAGPLGVLMVAAIMVLLIVGSVLVQRRAAQDWFDAAAAP